jgi:hypothetical protein
MYNVLARGNAARPGFTIVPETGVTKLAVMTLLGVLALGCRTVSGNGAGGAGVGADSPKGAVEMMLAAAQIQDIQAVSAVWGDEKGMTRDRVDRAELEQRALVMICLLRHDSQKLGEPQQASGGRYHISVDLVQKTNSATTTFMVARSPAGRWLVTTFDPAALQNKGFCPRAGD